MANLANLGLNNDVTRLFRAINQKKNEEADAQAPLDIEPVSNEVPPSNQLDVEPITEGSSPLSNEPWAMLAQKALNAPSTPELDQEKESQLREFQAQQEMKRLGISNEAPKRELPASLAKEQVEEDVTPEKQTEAPKKQESLSDLIKNLYSQKDPELVKAQQEREMVGLASLLGKSGAKIGEAFSLGAYKPDYTAYDKIAEMGGQGVKNIEEQRKALSEKLVSVGKTKELQKFIELDDPTSLASKGRRDVLNSTFPEVASKIKDFDKLSANALDAVLPTAIKFYVHKKEVEEMAKIRQANQQSATEEKHKKEIRTGEDKLMGSLNQSLKQSGVMQGMNNSEKLVNEINEMIKDPNSLKGGIKNLGAKYQVIKLFDINSAVREGELKLLRNAGSVGVKLANFMDDLAQGRASKEQLNEMLQYAKGVNKHYSDTYYKDYAKPSIAKAEKRGYDLGNSIPFFHRVIPHMAEEMVKPNQIEQVKKANPQLKLTDEQAKQILMNRNVKSLSEKYQDSLTPSDISE